MKKPWGGRFGEETARSVERFTESVSFDRRLWKHDIEGSIAHAEMLAACGIISPEDAVQIVRGLLSISAEIENGTFIFREELEDVHMNIESSLTERIGEAGARLHTARSRNDQVALDLRLYLRDETDCTIALLRELISIFMDISEKHLGAVMPGFTHLQTAQPVLLSHHLMAYAQMLFRDLNRFTDIRKRIDVMPLGACALAGTTLPIDRERTARSLGFGAVAENSIDAVSDRDFAAEFIFAASLTMMHLSRLAEELILWSTVEFAFVSFPDAFTTGSSIMPQKRNPDVAELIRGRTGRVYGNLTAVLTMMKGLPLAYNRDMQEDKEPVFDTADTLRSVLSIVAEMLPRVKFGTDIMAERSAEGFSTATDIAEYLVRKGVPFRKAHEITGSIVRFCTERGKTLAGLSAGEYRAFSDCIGDDIGEAVTPEASVTARKSFGGTAPERVREQITRLRAALDV